MRAQAWISICNALPFPSMSVTIDLTFSSMPRFAGTMNLSKSTQIIFVFVFVFAAVALVAALCLVVGAGRCTILGSVSAVGVGIAVVLSNIVWEELLDIGERESRR